MKAHSLEEFHKPYVLRTNIPEPQLFSPLDLLVQVEVDPSAIQTNSYVQDNVQTSYDFPLLAVTNLPVRSSPLE